MPYHIFCQLYQVEVVALSSYEEKEELFKEQVCHLVEFGTSNIFNLKFPRDSYHV